MSFDEFCLLLNVLGLAIKRDISGQGCRWVRFMRSSKKRWTVSGCLLRGVFFGGGIVV